MGTTPSGVVRRPTTSTATARTTCSIGGAGNDTLDGGEEYDIVSYTPETGSLGVVANLSDVAWTYGTTVYQSNTGTDTFGDLDTYVNIENITGSVHNDILNAANSAQDVRLFGGDGDDTLIGSGTGDWLNGGMGNDTLINGTARYSGFAPVLVNLMTGRASGQGEDILSGITQVWPAKETTPSTAAWQRTPSTGAPEMTSCMLASIP